MHTDNKKNILIFDEGQTQGLDGTAITAEAKYSINFSRSLRKFSLSFYYNGNNIFVSATKAYQFKAKNSEIKAYPLCLENTSKHFIANKITKNRIKWTHFNAQKMKQETVDLVTFTEEILNEKLHFLCSVYKFSVDYNVADIVILSIFINI